jgi:chemotaxis response regulator CheB
VRHPRAGGVTTAQKLETAAQPDMPESAIASGCVDFILSPEVIAVEIAKIAQRDARDIVQSARG